MAKSDKSKSADPDLHSDAWSRFERAIDVVAKSPPQHRSAPATGAKRKASPPKRAAKRPKKTQGA
jgi:hypothetical protein